MLLGNAHFGHRLGGEAEANSTVRDHVAPVADEELLKHC